MSFFSGTARIGHSSKLPAGATREHGIAMLRDHEFFIRCDPHLNKLEVVKTDTPPGIPDAIKSQACGETHSYLVTDRVHTLPAGIWDSNIASTWETTDITNGIFVRIKGPMSIVMDTIWEIRAGEDGALELAEEVTITCSRLLLGIVKSECEGGWDKIHAKMIARVEESIKNPSK
ncbi:hypothetical protein B0H63DRAFT_516415 [Podospora didyma]|uniref:DUF7053 domain-containing protein n=1 Tax=Podospora didyma TaxID=330526 RepID=A0AAE0U6W5_9PEZI|nr:hypothetical protein B0H63DRAFT_516415 [Podospora didyma]